MKADYMDNEIMKRFPIEGNFNEIADKIDYSTRRKKTKRIDFRRLAVPLSLATVILLGSILIPDWMEAGVIPKDIVGSWEKEYVYVDPNDKQDQDDYVPRWEEKTIVQKYPSFTYLNKDYQIFSAYITEGIDESHVGNVVDEISVQGYDEYEKDKEYFIHATIYELQSIDTQCAYAIQFSESQEYYAYLNNTYQFQTLDDLIVKLNLEAYLELGTAHYGYSDREGYHQIVFDDFEDGIVWEYLLNDRSLANACLENKNAYAATWLSVSASVPALGISNVSLAVNKKGYVQTNILGIRKAFYIGEENTAAFVSYVLENIHGKEIVYFSSASSNQESSALELSPEYVP